MMECKKCNTTNNNKANFCGACGTKLKLTYSIFNYKKQINKISIFFFTLVVYNICISLIETDYNYINTLFIDLGFIILVSIFYFIDFKETNKLFQFKKLNNLILLIVCVALPLLASLVYYFTDFINQYFFELIQMSYYEHFIYSPAPLLLSIVSIALMPAIFEEIAFRGIIFNQLVKLTSLKSSILISAILFTILHFSLISILWIFPLGLLFGYFRARYRTLWFGILGHFIYNSSVILIEYYYLSYDFIF